MPCFRRVPCARVYAYTNDIIDIYIIYYFRNKKVGKKVRRREGEKVRRKEGEKVRRKEWNVMEGNEKQKRASG